MEGEIAVLYQMNKQIGGVYDWSINLSSDYTVEGGYQKYKFKKNISANAYWLIDTPADDCYEVKFYKIQQGSLILMDAGIVDINLPDTKTFNRRLDAPVDLIWIKPLEY